MRRVVRNYVGRARTSISSDWRERELADVTESVARVPVMVAIFAPSYAMRANTSMNLVCRALAPAGATEQPVAEVIDRQA